MCLYPMNSKLMVATKKIEVYKVLQVDMRSPFQDFEYKIGKTVEVKTRLGGDKSKKNVHEGLHACVNIQRARRLVGLSSRPRRIYLAVIPKGAIYKLGYDSDIVSNKLRVVKEIQNRDH